MIQGFKTSRGMGGGGGGGNPLPLLSSLSEGQLEQNHNKIDDVNTGPL